MPTISASAKKMLFFVVLALVFAAVDAIYIRQAYRLAYDRGIEAKKAEVTALVRGATDDVIVFEEQFVAPAPTELAEQFRGMFARVQSPTVIRMKVWNEEQQVVWSNLSDIMGQSFPDNEEIPEVFASGVTLLSVEDADDELLAERQFARLLEVYVPIYGITDEGSSGQVIGVVEIYEPATQIERPAVAEAKRAALPAVTISLVAYVLILVALRRRA